MPGLFLYLNNPMSILTIRNKKTDIMADNKEQKGKSDRNKVSGSENYEIQYFKDTLGVSSQAVAGAIRATKSNDRKVLT
ncbi:MAG: DUF3606 domain-containing protein, partial [Sphingobacteriales bacterium]